MSNKIRKINQNISDYPAVSDRFDPNFYEDMEAWITHGANTTKDEQNNLKDQINNTVDDINNTINDINTKNTNVNNKHTDVVNKHSEVVTARDTAVAKANEVKNLQLPTQATYTYEEFDKMFATSFKRPGFITHDKPLIHPEDIFLETNIPNVIVDKKAYPIFDGDKVIDRGKILQKKVATSSYSASRSFQTNDTNIYFVGQTIGIYSKDDKLLIAGKIESIKNHMAVNIDFSYGKYNRVKGELYYTRELDLIQLQKSPFATATTDELLDDKVHGLVCQQSHGKGDFVVTGNELVTNLDTGDSNTGWNFFGSGYLNDDSFVTINGEVRQNVPTVVGQEYIISLYYDRINSTCNGQLKVRQPSNRNTIFDSGLTLNADGVYTFRFTATESSMEINLLNYFNANTQIYKNISVRLGDSIYQSNKNTNEMYDELIPHTGIFAPKHNYVYLYDDTSGGIGSIGHYYLRLSSTHSGANVELFNFISDTTAWLDLGTAENMSLENPYFKKLDKVLRKDYVLWNKITQKYETFKGINCFEKADVTADEFVSKYTEFNIVRGNLISDGVTEYIYIGVFERLNAGAYHYAYNEFGCARTSNSLNAFSYPWYHPNANKNFAIYDTFKYASTDDSGSITDKLPLSGRDDKKFYDKIYKEQLNCNFLPKANRDSLIEERVYLDNYYANGGNVCEFTDEIIEVIQYVETGISSTVGIVYNSNKTDPIIGSSIYHNKEIARIKSINRRNDSQLTLILDRKISRVANKNIKIVRPSKSASYGTRTYTDIIGNPKDYPNDWKTHLENGNSIIGNALLISEDISYIPDGTNLTRTMSKKSLKEFQAIYSESEGHFWSTWSTFQNSFNQRENTFNSTMPIGRLAICSYKAKNTIPQIELQTIDYISDKVVASNSHSIYKGANIANSITRSVNVGNGTNGYESKFLESILGLDFEFIIEPDITVTVEANKKYFMKGFSSLDGVYLSKTNQTRSFNSSSIFKENEFWTKKLNTIPIHNTINLDNSNSKAAKWFSAISKDYYQIFIKELAYNTTTSSYDGDNNKFDQLTNGTQTDLNGKKIKTKVVGVKLC